MKKFIITESEKNQIRGMYGLITESDDDEIISYIDSYLNSRDCSSIANDMESLKKTPTYTSLSEENKKTYDLAIWGLNNPGTAIVLKHIPCNETTNDKKEKHCKCLKNYMRQQFMEQLKSDRQNVVSQVCGFTTKFPPKQPLSACSPKVNNGTQTNTNTTAPVTQKNTNTTAPATQTNTNTIAPSTSINTNAPVTATSSTTNNTNGPVTTTSSTNSNTDATVTDATTTNDTTSASTTTVSSDYKLDTKQKIQDFQTWMDENHGKWAYSKKYRRNYSVDGKPNRGFGNMGPNTTKAWNNSEYKNAYLQEKGITSK